MKLKALRSNPAYGIFEEEAFWNKDIVQYLKRFSISTEIEHHPEATGEEDDPRIWHIHYIKIPGSVDKIIPAIQKGMYDGWYILLQQDDHTYVVFNNGVRDLEWDFKGVAELAARHGLSPKYMKHYLKKGLDDLQRVFER